LNVGAGPSLPKGRASVDRPSAGRQFIAGGIPLAEYTKGEKSKEHLVKSAARLFVKKGYNATGINDILSSAELSKGSFYFYFASKKELAAAVAEYFNKNEMRELAEAAENRTWTPFVDKLMGDIIERAKRKKIFGCPFAVLGMEIAFLEPDIADQYYRPLKNIQDVFEDVLKRTGLSAGDAAVAAECALALYEGYLIFYRINKDVEILEKLLRDLKGMIGKSAGVR
jgi:AcrR family transcriptional regulator